MKTKRSRLERTLAMLLSLLMIFAMFPVDVLAATSSTLTTDIGEKTFAVGVPTEFSFTTTANDDAGIMVIGTSDFSNSDAIEKLEYKESKDGKWYEFDGDFGPSSGFPMSDATSIFRVTFKKAGNYTFTAAMKRVDNNETLCSVKVDFSVTKTDSVITTDIGDKEFIIGNATEFSFTTTANDDAGIMVIGTSDFSDPDAIEKLEYKETKDGNWYELKGDFGPSTGFPMSDATSIFRVTFRKAGNYSFTASMKSAASGEILCSVNAGFKVLNKFNVNISKNVGGTVTLNSEKTSSLTVKEGSDIALDVKADAGYRIASVTVNGTLQKTDGASEFNKFLTITSNTDIEVVFEKIYTISISYDNEKGIVNTTPDCVAGSVSVNTGTTVDIKATPNENFRVSKVSITGAADEVYEDNTYNHANSYSKKLIADNDYNIEITFAPLVYNISVNSSANGSLSVSESTVNIGETSKVTVIAEAGYKIDTVTVNNVNVYENIIDDKDDDNKFYIVLENVRTDMQVNVTFKKTENASMKDLFWNSVESLRTDGKGLFVFKKGTSVYFSTEKEAVKIIYADGSVDGGRASKSVEINSNKTITKIQLRYDHSWHDVVFDGNLSVLEVYFDTTVPATAIEAVNKANVNGYYNNDVEIKITAEDGGKYSGLNTVEYWVVCDGKETARETIFNYSAQKQEKAEFEGAINIAANANDSESVTVYVKATDRAGNESVVKEIPLKICTANPIVNVEFDDEQSKDAVDNWYNFNRKATITITDRADVFDEAAATAGIKFDEGSANDYSITWTNDNNTHIANIEFTSEGTYSWSYSYINKADLEASVTEKGNNIYSFGIDTTNPDGIIEVKTSFWSRGWSELLKKLTFGLYTNSNTGIGLKGGAGEDALSGYQKVSFYKSDCDNVLAESELINLYNAGKFIGEVAAIEKDEQFAVYARIVDNAGNVKYIGTDGVIYDVTESEIVFDVKDAPNGNSIYGVNNVKEYTVDDSVVKGVNIGVAVKDANADNDFYSGIKNVSYNVTMSGKITQQGLLYQFDKKNPSKKDLIRTWSGDVIVNAELNNGKEVKISVNVEDNAGNKTENSITLKEINLDPITAIVTVAGKAETLVDDYGWYDSGRSATVIIKDRASCFDDAAATKAIKIIAEDIKGNNIELEEEDVVISTWTHNDDMHTATVDFNRDGIYKWHIEYTNKAGNTLDEKNINYGSSESPSAFTVDTIKPTRAVTVDAHTWRDTILSALTFGLYSKNSVEINAFADDDYSPFEIEYYKYNGSKALSYDMLQALYADNESFKAEMPEITGDEQFAVYIRVTDNSGNFIYVSSDGYVIDPNKTILTVEAVEEANNNIYGISNLGSHTVDGETVNGVKVAINAKEAENVSEAYSGIKNISYEVKADINGSIVTTQSGTLYDFVYERNEDENNNGGSLTIKDANSDDATSDGTVPTKEMLCREWAGCIIVDAEKNNSCNVVVSVTVTDNAGNESYQDLPLDIDFTAPKIDVEYNNNNEKNDKYFDAERVATVTFTERSKHFDQAEAEKGIVISAVNSKGVKVEDAYSIAWTKDTTSKNPDENKFIATITYLKGANYKFAVSYADKAGNKNEAVNTGSSIAPFDFTVDTQDPYGSVTVNGNIWTKFLDVISFGMFDISSASVTAAADDDTSPVTVEYCKTNSDKAYTKEEVKKLDFIPFEPFTVKANEQFNVYLKITDYAGHIVYINSDGYIVDSEKSSLAVSVVDDPNSKEIFGINEVKEYTVDGKTIKGVKLHIDANEDTDVYSGISEIKYNVVSKLNGEDVTTQSEVLYKFGYTRGKDENSNGGDLTVTDVNAETVEKSGEGVPAKSDLLKDWSGDIVVNAEKNNSSNVVVTVTVVDNAGNEHSETAELNIDINTPTIDISFDNNSYINDKYFNAERTATIVITERSDHFDAKAATDGIVITAVDSEGTPVDGAYTISAWTDEAKGNNPDKSTHTATIEFKKDANYTFTMFYAGKSGNAADIKYPENCAANDFAVDTTNPEGEIKINERIWGKLFDVLTFGLFSMTNVDVDISATDKTSPYTIEYYKTNDPIAYSADKLDTIDDFKDYEKFTVNSSEQFVVYAKITDYAGNYVYINSDGYIVDLDTAKIRLTPAEANENGLYNGDVDIKIDVTEINDEQDLKTNPYSGIAKVEYWVVCGTGEEAGETQRETLYSFDYTRENGENSNGGKLTITDWASGEKVVTEQTGNVPRKEQLKSDWSGNISVIAEKNNNCIVYVHVGVTDNAGNYSEQVQKLDIDVTAPTINVTYDGTSNDGANSGYYTSRTATVVITERNHHFDSKAATDGIVITAVNAKGEAVDNAYTISSWATETDGKTADTVTHTAIITYVSDANYTFDISYTDKAGNKAADYKQDKFTVDSTAPVGTVTAKSAEGREEIWSSLVDSLTFGFWSNTKISVSGTSSDETSPIKSVEYYMPVAESAEDATTALKKADLDNISTENWQSFEKFDVTANTQFTVYIKITDYAGNYTYIGTNGLIVDDQHPVEESVAPEISVSPEKPVNGIYSGDVKVSIIVDDPMVGGTYSGIKEVSYKVFDRDSKTPDKATQEGTLYTFDNPNPKQSDLLKTWTGEITVSAAKNNSNNIQIVVYATDNSLNAVDNSQKESKSYAVIKVDTTAPVIDVSYDNNNVDSGSYFSANRTATVNITERNFNAEDVKITITNTDGAVPTVVGWKETKGTYNCDDTVHTATISYTTDGDYTFAVEYTDLAGNECKNINYGPSAVPTEFTIDKTLPTVNVSYNNNSSLNGNYYKDVRTATIVIDEHNFNASRVNVMITATDDGVNTTVPSISGWNNNGDRHTTTVYYQGDARYTFDIAMTDLAGNASADYTEDTFYIDRTAPTVEITGVADQSANNGEVIPVVSCSDTNYDDSQVKITLAGANRKDVALLGSYSDIHNGKMFTFSDFAHEQEIDDIYTLSATLTDKAGNSTSDTISFSVNRFGSTYSMDKQTENINGKYVQTEKDIVITEVNANELSNIKIMLFKNNETIVLKLGTNYKIDVVGGNGSWYRYVYTIFAKNFADDGVYRLSVHSEDAAGNIAENTLDSKDFEINFGIDKSLPSVNLLNLKNGTTYALDNLTVQMTANDNLKLAKVTVYIDGNNYQSWSGEEIESVIAAGGMFTFDISGDSKAAHNLKVIAVDAAGNEYAEEVEEFYVTTNLGVRYYNNKPLFYGSIAGVILVVGLIIFIVVRRRKKNEQSE